MSTIFSGASIFFMIAAVFIPKHEREALGVQPFMFTALAILCYVAARVS